MVLGQMGDHQKSCELRTQMGIIIMMVLKHRKRRMVTMDHTKKMVMMDQMKRMVTMDQMR